MVKEQITNTGVMPSTASADDGYSTQQGRDEVLGLGLKVVSLSGAKGKKIIEAPPRAQSVSCLEDPTDGGYPADPGKQSDQDGRVSGPLGVGFYRGAVNQALLKIIQTPVENIT